MATNIQIGLAYVIGKNRGIEHEIVHLDEVLDDAYKPYALTMHEGLHESKKYVLFKDIGTENSRVLVDVDACFTLTQVIHILEEVIAYDLKKNK